MCITAAMIHYIAVSYHSLITIFSDETRNFYNDVQTASTSEEFSDLKSQATSAAVFDYSEPSDQSSETPSSLYKVSNPIRITEFIFKIIRKIIIYDQAIIVHCSYSINIVIITVLYNIAGYPNRLGSLSLHVHSR